MRTLTHQEKRTIRYASVGIGIYLVLWPGFIGSDEICTELMISG